MTGQGSKNVLVSYAAVIFGSSCNVPLGEVLRDNQNNGCALFSSFCNTEDLCLIVLNGNKDLRKHVHAHSFNTKKKKNTNLYSNGSVSPPTFFKQLLIPPLKRQLNIICISAFYKDSYKTLFRRCI